MSDSISVGKNTQNVKNVTSKDTTKATKPMKASHYLSQISSDLVKNGIPKEQADQFIKHPVVKKTTEQYVQSLAKKDADKAGGGAGLSLYARITLVFANTQTRLNNKVAFWNKKQEAINKLLPELAKIIKEINEQMNGHGRQKYINIPPDLLAYIEKHEPGSFVDQAGDTHTGSLTDWLKKEDEGQLVISDKNSKPMSALFSGYETDLTSSNSTKTQLQNATQQNLNFSKEMGQLISTLFSIGKENARKI